MKTIIHLFWSLSVIVMILFFPSCKKEMSDAQKLEALKDVTFTFNSMSMNLHLPAGALSGASFDSLMAQDSALYANPENYSIDFLDNFTADNTKDNAEDAKFDGMTVNIIFDTIHSTPVATTASAFEIPKNTTQQVTAQGSLNLKTHRRAGLYIFQQMVDGLDIATTQTILLNYTVGILNGVIQLPDIHENIPTTVSDETKAFLSGLIASGVFNSK
jgi:hypothetical protein